MEIVGIDGNGNSYVKEVPGEWIRGRIVGEGQVEAIKFVAEVAKVTTLADGGIRVVLDLGEDGCQVMRVLAECKQNGVVLKIQATLQETNESRDAKEGQ